MFRVFQEEKLITILMFACMGISIFVRVFLGMLYRNLIKEADNMASTENKQLKQCKLKFANCYQMSNGVSNIQVFVDKFLNRISFMHISYGALYHLSGQMMLLSVVFSGVGICRGILTGRTLGDVLPFYIVSFFGMYVYFSISTMVDVKGKRRVLRVNLVDYLENHFAPRINVTKRDLEMLYGETLYEEKGRIGGGRERRTVELMPIGGSRLAAGAENLQSSRGKRAAEQTLSVRPLNGEKTEETVRESAQVSEEELEALLKEFLTS